jgi:hypothetical protein
MPIRHDFEAPFEVELYEREGGGRSYRTKYTYLLYRWLYKKDGMTGMGIYGPSVRYCEALGTSTTIFQAEMYKRRYKRVRCA